MWISRSLSVRRQNLYTRIYGTLVENSISVCYWTGYAIYRMPLQTYRVNSDDVLLVGARMSLGDGDDAGAAAAFMAHSLGTDQPNGVPEVVIERRGR